MASGVNMNQSIFTLAEQRQSVRKFTDKPIEKEALVRCVEAARIAPSANNCQPWQFIVVDDPPMVRKVAEATFSPAVSFNKFTLGARVMTIVLSEKPNLITQIGGAVKNIQFQLLDVGMAVENFCLQATHEGIGTCILGWFHEKTLREFLDIPKRKKITLVIAMGYPAAGEIRAKKRKEIDSILFFNRYGAGK